MSYSWAPGQFCHEPIGKLQVLGELGPGQFGPGQLEPRPDFPLFGASWTNLPRTILFDSLSHQIFDFEHIYIIKENIEIVTRLY